MGWKLLFRLLSMVFVLLSVLAMFGGDIEAHRHGILMAVGLMIYAEVLT